MRWAQALCLALGFALLFYGALLGLGPKTWRVDDLPLDYRGPARVMGRLAGSPAAGDLRLAGESRELSILWSGEGPLPEGAVRAGGAEVVAVGVVKGGVLEASRILPKCAARYVPAYEPR